MKNLIVLLFVTMLAVGCAQINPVSGLKGDNLQEKFSNDIARTAELATKYGATDIAMCANYLNGVVGNGNTLLNEPTAGLISFAVKAYLLKNSSVANEAAFKTNCGAFAAGVMLEAAKNAPVGGQLLR